MLRFAEKNIDKTVINSFNKCVDKRAVGFMLVDCVQVSQSSPAGVIMDWSGGYYVLTHSIIWCDTETVYGSVYTKEVNW